MSTNNLNRPVLVVDDEADIRDLMEMTLMKMGLRVDTAEGVRAALSKLSSNKYSLVLTDMRMPDGSGLEVVQHINQQHLDVPVAVITAFGSADQAVQALKEGAFDYLQKPITLAQLRTLVKSAIKVQEDNSAPPAAAEPEPQAAPPQSPPVIIDIDDEDDFQAAATAAAQPIAKQPEAIRQPENAAGELPRSPAKAPAGKPAVPVNDSKLKMEADLPRLLGSSPQIETVRQMIRKLARTTVPVYIAGESGSGKEQAARSIHELSERRDRPFVAVNCGAIPENLMESEFFGYKKGSFTGADQDRLGFFQHAHGGTLFLDEVADLPLAMQVKLLRAIQEKAVRRIGDARETFVDVRIICATHKNLEALVDSGAFRQDLYYRLNVVTLHMPPLREMREDLGALILYLLYKHRHGTQTYKLSPKAQEALLHYSYPGNFRELENILERAVALTVGQVIQVDDLQIQNAPQVKAERSGFSFDDIAEPDARETTLNHSPIPPFDPRTMQIQDYLDQVERSIIEQALQQTRYNRTQAAKLLGISFRSMRYRMERLDIN
mgnify:CR=1 FL=1